MLIIGLMSGTSVDGIDAALVNISGAGRKTHVELVYFCCVPYTPELRNAIFELCRPCKGSVPDFCVLNSVIGEKFADAALAVCDAAQVPISQVSAIASHGQTIWHQPIPRSIAGSLVTGTLQIGEPAIIAARTGIQVVSNFRAADMAAGGQGAPLVPYADWILFSSPKEDRAVQNIGGIANVTYLKRGGNLEDVTAFDTGPGNMVVDGVVRALSGGEMNFDKDGAWAAKGNIHDGLLEQLLDNAFFRLPPPKSTGREQFGEQYVKRVLQRATALGLDSASTIATATALTAESIVRAYRNWLDPRGGTSTVILGGGGVHNRTLVRILEEKLSPARVTTHAVTGIPEDAKEAIAFAILGYQTIHNRTSNVPSATGAAYQAVLGSITPAGKAKSGLE
jgi:anhydro-N-acetylmuramic acid kinase